MAHPSTNFKVYYSSINHILIVRPQGVQAKSRRILAFACIVIRVKLRYDIGCK
jgi:hypothetical protein